MEERFIGQKKCKVFSVSSCLHMAALLVGICLFCSSSVHAQAPDIGWVRQFGGVAYQDRRKVLHSRDFISAFAVDGKGNSLITGRFDTSTPSFAAPSGAVSIQPGSFVAKYDTSGKLLWTKSIGTNGNFLGVAADAWGNAYVSGYTNVAYFSNGIPQSHVLLTKYDPLGNALWCIQTQGDAEDDGNQISLDAATNIYMGGVFSSSNFAIGSVTLANDHVRKWPADWKFDEFVAKFDSSGKPLWAKALHGADADISAPNPKSDISGDVIVTGIFAHPLNLGTTVLMNTSPPGIFAVAYDSTGNLLSAKEVATADFWGSHQSTVDSAGTIYLSGTFMGPAAQFGQFTLTNTGAGSQVFLAKLDRNGNVHWATQARASRGAMFEGGGLFVDAHGCIYQTAWGSCSSVDLGGTVLTSPAADIAYVAKFDARGNIQWGLSMQSMLADLSRTHPCFIQADALGNVYLAGNFTDWTLGSSFSAINDNKNFLAKLNSPGANFRATDNRR